jgi:hypothetical protein
MPVMSDACSCAAATESHNDKGSQHNTLKQVLDFIWEALCLLNHSQPHKHESSKGVQRPAVLFS